MKDQRHAAENNVPQTGPQHSRLTERPERHRKSAGALLFILCGGLLLLGGVGVLLWQLTSHTGTNTSTGTRNPLASSVQSAKQPAGCTGAREPLDVIQQQTAQGLHLTVAQVQARILKGKAIGQIATEQGLSAVQLHNVEIQALNTANNYWHNKGCSTQQDIQDNLRRDTGSATYMDAEFTNWFKQ